MQTKIIVCRRIEILVGKAPRSSLSRNNSYHHSAWSSIRIMRTKIKNNKQQRTICNKWSRHIRSRPEKPNHKWSTHWDKWRRRSFYLFSIKLGSQIKRKMASNPPSFIPTRALSQLSYTQEMGLIRVNHFDGAKQKVIQAGLGAIIVKQDFKDVFRHIPVSQQDW